MYFRMYDHDFVVNRENWLLTARFVWNQHTKYLTYNKFIRVNENFSSAVILALLILWDICIRIMTQRDNFSIIKQIMDKSVRDSCIKVCQLHWDISFYFKSCGWKVFDITLFSFNSLHQQKLPSNYREIFKCSSTNRGSVYSRKRVSKRIESWSWNLLPSWDVLSETRFTPSSVTDKRKDVFSGNNFLLKE